MEIDATVELVGLLIETHVLDALGWVFNNRPGRSVP
jgi:hypothetical protein